MGAKEDSCTLCWLWRHDAKHNLWWNGDGKVTPGKWKSRQPTQPSILQKAANFAGAVVQHVAAGLPTVSDAEHRRRLDICQTCPNFNGSNCSLCGCNMERKAWWAEQRCPIGKWNTLDDGWTRHLIYHVWPVRGNGIWQLNLDQLRSRLSLFNGKRVIAIVTDSRTDTAESVQDFMAGERIDHWIIKRNEPNLREVVTWLDCWSEVLTTEPNHATFTAHAKGVRHPVNRGVSIHDWTYMLYVSSLDYWPLVAETLGKYPVAGSCKKVGHGFGGSQSSWHYSGTFFWARNADVFSRGWRFVDPVWWGTESWVGVHFRPDEAGCLFHSGEVPTLNMYSRAYLDGLQGPFEQWQRDNQKYRLAVG